MPKAELNRRPQTPQRWRAQYVQAVQAIQQLIEGGSRPLEQLFPSESIYGRKFLDTAKEAGLVHEVAENLFTAANKRELAAILMDEERFCALGGFSTAHASDLKALLYWSGPLRRKTAAAARLQPIFGIQILATRVGRSGATIESLCGIARLPEPVQARWQDVNFPLRRWREIRDAGAGTEADMLAALEAYHRAEEDEVAETPAAFDEPEEEDAADDDDVTAKEIASAALKLAMATHRLVQELSSKIDWMAQQWGYGTEKKAEDSNGG